MDPCTLVTTLVSAGERYATSTDDLQKLVAKVMVMSLKYVEKKSIWAAFFGEGEYVDWALVDKSTHNVLGDLNVWLPLLSLCSWEDMQRHEAAIATGYPCLSSMRRILRAVSLDPGGARGWTIACIVFLFTYLRGVITLQSLEMLTCGELKKNTRVACMEFLSQSAEVQYTPQELQKEFVFFLGNLRVDTLTLQQNLAIALARREEKRHMLKLKTTVVIQGRPRLRDKLKAEYKTEEVKAQNDILLSTWDSYQGWLYLHSLPNALSDNVKRKLYFMSSQVYWPWKDHLSKILPSDGAIVNRIAQYPVSQPDLGVIMGVLTSLRMDGSSPFQELIDFRSRCLQALPTSHVNKIQLGDILKAYAAVYQPPAIWNDCFRTIIGVISVQIVRDVDAFVRSHPFASEPFMALLVKA